MDLCQFCGIVNPEEGLDTQGCCWDDTACKERLKAERDELKKRVGELDGIIKSAPHSELCNSRYYIVGEGKNYLCDCFKSEIKTPTGRGLLTNPLTEEKTHKKLLYGLLASLTLCEHMGDVMNDIQVVLNSLGITDTWDDMEELQVILHARGITTLHGTSLGDE